MQAVLHSFWDINIIPYCRNVLFVKLILYHIELTTNTCWYLIQYYYSKLLLAGQMSRMPCGTPNPLPGSSRVPYQCYVTAVSGAPRKYCWRTPRPHRWAGHGEMQRLLGEGLLRPVRTLRQESLWRLQVSPHGGPTQRNPKNQQPNTPRNEPATGYP